MDDFFTNEFNRRRFFFLIRLILSVLIAGLCVFELFFAFRGLNSPAAMDNAQVARQIACGEGQTTKMLRPLDIIDQRAAIKEAAKEEGLNYFDSFPDTYNAPLHARIVALALRLTGYHDFEAKRMNTDETNIYGGDRIVAAIGVIFFVLSLALAYILFRALFDEVLASTIVAFVGLSQLMLQFAVSGLAQPILLCMILAAGCCIVKAIKAETQGYDFMALLMSAAAYVILVLMSLTHNLAAWCLIGYIVFSGFYFRPRGMHAVLGFVALGLGVVLPAFIHLYPMGGMTAKFLHSIYSAFGSDNGELLMRSADNSAVTFSNSFFFMRALGYLFDQFGHMYTYMGSIVVTPFFLLSLLNRYKNPATEGLKWAVFAMWCSCGIGMTCFARPGALSEDQLYIIFAPFFAAYGTALVFNFLGRMQLGTDFGLVRAFTIFILLLVSCGSFMMKLPQELGFSILTSARGIPQYPPYYPPTLNGKLCDISNPQDVIISDQPWAVAWYANRKSIWLPRSIDTYTNRIEPQLNTAKQGVQGILITPSSHTVGKNGFSGIIAANGDFAPLVMEGKLLQIVPKHNIALTEVFNTQGNSQVKSRTLASIASSQGDFANRNFLLGADIVYYSRQDVSGRDRAEQKK